MNDLLVSVAHYELVLEVLMDKQHIDYTDHLESLSE